MHNVEGTDDVDDSMVDDGGEDDGFHDKIGLSLISLFIIPTLLL